MPSKETSLKIAIVGLGPRGLAALEAIVQEALDDAILIEIDVFDPKDKLGAGPNYAPEQSELCLLNVPVRALSIEPGPVLSGHIGPYEKWASEHDSQNDFPPRSLIGEYLVARFNTLRDAISAEILVNHTKGLVEHISASEDGWGLTSDGHSYGPFDEVLLTLGQPLTSPDTQFARWQDHAEQHDLTLMPAYPANALIAAAKEWRGQTVAVRGLGLTTFDVIRMLTIGLGGTFSQGNYIPSGQEPRKITPFSLNGLPPAPKPATSEIKDLFSLHADEIRRFEAALHTSVSQHPRDALETICNALITPVTRILNALQAEADETAVSDWLAIEQTDPGAQDTHTAIDALAEFIDMAHGRRPPAIGYVVGQVWHNLQNELRHSFNLEHTNPKTKARILALDESLKRVSAGPPVEAAEQLLILIKSGLITLRTVEDPAVVLEPTGWRLIEDRDELVASVMLDAVLPSPDLMMISDPLVISSVKQGIAKPFAEGLGAATQSDGQLIGSEGRVQTGLCALGRLAFGSFISVDSLTDCFGPSTTGWAKGVIDRHLSADDRRNGGLGRKP